MNKGQSYSISFAVVTSDGVCIEPDESKTITCAVGTKITVQTRDISPGCNGGLSYFKYGQLSSWAVSFSPDMYATVENGWHMVSAKAVITTPEATSYVHEYYVNVCGVLLSVDKKDPVYDDAIDFFLQEEVGDDATHAFRSHRLKEGVPLVLKSGAQFKVYARTLVYGSEAYLSRFEYNKQQRSIGECTVADGQHQLMVHGYRRLATACADVIYTKRAFTIIGQPPLSEETSTKMTDTKGSRNAAYYGFGFTLVTSAGECHKLFEEEPVTLPSGTVFEVHVTASAPQDVASINDFKYEGPFQSHMCTAVEGKKTLTVYAQRKHDGGWCQHYKATFTIIGEPKADEAPPLSEEKSTKMADTKEGSSYDLFVETCDDDPVCYPVSDDGRVEVPAGTRFRFVATSNVEGRKASVHCFAYCGEEMLSRVLNTKARVTSFTQVSRVTVTEVRTSDRRVVKHGTTDVTIIPIPNDRSGCAAPVADLEVTPPLGKDVECKRNDTPLDRSAASSAPVEEKEVLEQLVFCSPCEEEFAYDSDTRTVAIPPGYVFLVNTACSGHKINWCTYHGERALRAKDNAFVCMAKPAALKIHVTTGLHGSCTVQVNVFPSVINAEYDGLILTASEPAKKTYTVPPCADAEGVHGKRFVPPWSDEERACEECFLTRVGDPRGWKATTGSGACNYTPMRVWLERADNDMPFAENEDGDYLIPYGTKVVARTDRGEISTIRAGDRYYACDRPFDFEPNDDKGWTATVRVSFKDSQHHTADFKFLLRPDESDDELKVIWEHKRIQNAIWNTTDTLNCARESLEKTWEKIQAAQDKLTELKVQQAKLESK